MLNWQYRIALLPLALVVTTDTPAFAQTDTRSTIGELPGAIFSIIATLTIIAIYFSPTIIAFRKNHPNKILYLLLNTVLGITVIGWAALLILVHLDIYVNSDGKIVNNSIAKK